MHSHCGYDEDTDTWAPGADVTGLLPKYFTIVRGQLFCGIISLAIVPWKLLSEFCTAVTSDSDC